VTNQSREKVQTEKIIPSLQLQFLHHHLYGHLFLPNHRYQTLYLRIIRMHLVLSLSRACPELVLSPSFLPDWAGFFHSLEDLFQMAGKCFFHLPGTSINFQPAGHFFAGISGT
jgi:hypothetical protein